MGLFQALGALLDGSRSGSTTDPVRSLVVQALPDVDDDTHVIVTAVVGLLCNVAYADGEYRQTEADQIHRELLRIKGMDTNGAEALSAHIAEHIQAIGVAGSTQWIRDLKERTGKAFRLEVLEVLVELAAVDDAIDHQEVNQLRRLAEGLGLRQDAYNALQEKHREKLSHRS